MATRSSLLCSCTRLSLKEMFCRQGAGQHRPGFAPMGQPSAAWLARAGFAAGRRGIMIPGGTACSHPWPGADSRLAVCTTRLPAGLRRLAVRGDLVTNRWAASQPSPGSRQPARWLQVGAPVRPGGQSPQRQARQRPRPSQRLQQGPPPRGAGSSWPSSAPWRPACRLPRAWRCPSCRLRGAGGRARRANGWSPNG